jgi:hypothetical protein
MDKKKKKNKQIKLYKIKICKNKIEWYNKILY